MCQLMRGADAAVYGGASKSSYFSGKLIPTTLINGRGILNVGEPLNLGLQHTLFQHSARTATDHGQCEARDWKTMPVPARYLSNSPAVAFASSASLIPPPPINTRQPGVVTSLLYSGSRFRGHQKSKGNSYDVEVVLQVRLSTFI